MHLRGHQTTMVSRYRIGCWPWAIGAKTRRCWAPSGFMSSSSASRNARGHQHSKDSETLVPDVQQHRLTVANLQVRHGGSGIQGAAVQELASWVTDGSIRAMEVCNARHHVAFGWIRTSAAHDLHRWQQVADLGGGELAVVLGSSAGSLSRLRLTSPLEPGADPSEIQVRLSRSHHALQCHASHVPPAKRFQNAL